MWRPYVATAPQDVKVIAPDNIGYGQGNNLERGAPFKLEDEMEHLLSQLPASTKGVHLVAHSYGAFVALSLARRSDLPVRSLWIYEPVMFGSLLKEERRHSAQVQSDVRALYSPESAMLDPRNAATDVWLETFIDYWNGDGSWSLTSAPVKDMTRGLAWKMYQEVCCIAQEPLAFESYRFDFPLTLSYGTRTKSTTIAIAQRLKEENAQAQVDQFEGLNHMGIIGANEAIRASLRAHWERIFGA